MGLQPLRPSATAEIASNAVSDTNGAQNLPQLNEPILRITEDGVFQIVVQLGRLVLVFLAALPVLIALFILWRLGMEDPATEFARDNKKEAINGIRFFLGLYIGLIAVIGAIAVAYLAGARQGNAESLKTSSKNE